MQKQSRIVAGLDIGTTKICVIVGQMNEFGNLDIIGMGTAISEGVKDGVVINIAKTEQAISQALESAQKAANVDIKRVNVGIAGKHVKSFIKNGSITRSSRDGEISQEDIERLTNDMYRTVTEPGNEIIHVLPQYYNVDSELNVKEPVGMSGVRLEANFHIITASPNSIRNIKKCVERCGLVIDKLILEPMASSLAVLTNDEKEAGVAVVDIGGGTTDVAIFLDGIVRHTAVIPFGGDIITQDIKYGCSVMQNHAEKLKTGFGSCMPSKIPENEMVSIPGLRDRASKEISIKNLSYIIDARMEEIIELVNTEIIKSGFANKLAGGIVLTGGGAQLRNIKELFEYKTGFDTRLGHPNEYLGKIQEDRVKSTMYATGVGLVLAGYKPLDERDGHRFVEKQPQEDAVVKPVVEQAEPETPQLDRSNDDSGFLGFLKKAKGLLVDDFEDKSKY
ncbi:MAG: cell division protein FtsA [Cytophagales bacterium]|nr:MAG: cell division protein FtsA [Cytophagales bacterium]TAF60147.1 MAG: cell division protein FtsA [Cytophagales bacterium]